MKKCLLVLFILFLIASSALAQEEQISWERDFKKAQVTARETGRPMLLDFTAVWCKPCKMMDAQFWVLPEVAKAMKPFVAVKVDFDVQKDLVGKYGVGAIPFVAFTDPLGNLITFRRGFGSKNVREINEIFNLMPKDFSPVKKYYETLETKKDDGNALLQIADFYNNSKMLYLSCDFYKRALKTNEIKANPENIERIAATIGANYYSSKADSQAVDYLDNYLKDFPAGKHREVALAMIAISNANLGKQKDAVKYLEVLKKEFPGSKNVESVNKAIEDAKNRPDKK